MKAKGIFMFKGIQDRKAGEFTDKDSGEVVKYDASKILVVDDIEVTPSHERRFKMNKDNKQLLQDLSLVEPYTKIELVFDVILYSANAKVEPVSFEIV